MATLPQCWESVSLAWHKLKTEKSNKTSIPAIWLDTANAYGSMSHQSIYHPLKHYGIDCASIDFLTSYYNGLHSTSFRTNAWPS